MLADDNVPIGELSYPEAVLRNYANHVHNVYGDCVKRALKLQENVETFLKNPSQIDMIKARKAWLAARVPYGQSEAFRFYGGPIDGERGPEELINAWPIDEVYIDYVASNPASGIINRPEQYPNITEEFLGDMNGKDGAENVSTGYHAIEFLLWGQDKDAKSPGNRSFTDYVNKQNAKRRGIYLQSVSSSLVADLKSLVDAWAPGRENYRKFFLNRPIEESLAKIFTGIAFLSGAELAEERMFVPYSSMLQEDEHSCFSDNTHNDIYYNALAVQNVFLGTELQKKSNVAGGLNIFSLVREVNSELANDTKDKINNSVSLAKTLKPPFDQLLKNENIEGRASLKALIDSLRAQTKLIADCAGELGLRINIQ